MTPRPEPPMEELRRIWQETEQSEDVAVAIWHLGRDAGLEDAAKRFDWLFEQFQADGNKISAAMVQRDRVAIRAMKSDGGEHA